MSTSSLWACASSLVHVQKKEAPLVDKILMKTGITLGTRLTLYDFHAQHYSLKQHSFQSLTWI